jgi:hypothetical protein
MILGRSVRSPQVSLFSGYEDSKPIGEISLAEFLLSDRYKNEVEAIRQCSDKAKRRELKSKLPAITPSGIFSKRRNDALIQHSGFICIDIDGGDNTHISDWEALKSSLSGLSGLWYVGLSASGNGLFLVVKVKFPEQHTKHFHSIARDLSNRGIAVDMACKDVARLRGASYDPAPLFNPDTVPYEDLVAPTRKTPEIAPKQPDNEDLTARRVGRLVEAIEYTGANIADHYPDWYAIGRSLSSEFGESGCDWYHTISSQSTKYNHHECDIQYNRCLKSCSRTTISTFFGLCKDYGIMANGHRGF